MNRKIILIPPIAVLVAGLGALIWPNHRSMDPVSVQSQAGSNGQLQLVSVPTPGLVSALPNADPAQSGAASNPPENSTTQAVVRERLYNGILLEHPWPPSRPELSREAMPMSWVSNSSAVLPITVGRQLFVDDFLIESNSLKRAFHSANYYSNNPVLKPDQAWEMTEPNPAAMAYGGGMTYDASNKLFKLWYMGGYLKSTCLATSTNGLNWDKSPLDVKTNTNIVLDRRCESASVYFDQWETNADRRFKLFNTETADRDFRMGIYFSPDGVHWGKPAAQSGLLGERSTVFYNPVRRVWVYSIRANSPIGRSCKYYETTNLVSGSNWKDSQPVWWVGADDRDTIRPDLRDKPQLYCLEAFPYESLMVGLFTLWHGQPSDRATPTDIYLGYSRDGFNWYRPDHHPFIPVSEHPGDWNYSHVDSVAGGCLIVGRQLYFYVSGRSGVPGSQSSGVSSTGLATLRRDGFVSMDAGDQPGILTTRPLVFTGKNCFINADLKDGEMRVQLMDENNQILQVTNQTQIVDPSGKGTIAPGKSTVKLDFANCVPLANLDYTLVTVNWNGIMDLSEIRGKPVKFAFQLRKGSLYSFWVSPARNGPSGGFTAAGGPHFNAPVDTIGNKSYNPF